MQKSRGYISYTLNLITENDDSPKHPASDTSPLGSSIDDENNVQSLQIKQERMELSSSHDDESSLMKPLKRSRTDVADAESNTVHSGKSAFLTVSTLIILHI